MKRAAILTSTLLLVVLALTVARCVQPKQRVQPPVAVGSGQVTEPRGADVRPAEPDSNANSRVNPRVPTATLVELFGTVRVGAPPSQSSDLDEGVLTYSVEHGNEVSVSGELALDSRGWRVSVRGDATVRFHGFQLRGGRLRVRPEVVSADSNCPITLVAEYVPGPRLHIVDAQSGEPLSNLEVLASTYESRDIPTYASPTGGAQRIGQELVSPIATPLALTPFLLVWARSPGYAWGNIAIDVNSDVDACLALQPVARARIQLEGIAPGQFYRLRVLFDDGPSSVAAPRHPEVAATMHGIYWPAIPPLSVELPPGDWIADVETPLGVVTRGTEAHRFSTSPSQDVFVRIPIVSADSRARVKGSIRVAVDGDPQFVSEAYLKPKSRPSALHGSSVISGTVSPSTAGQPNLIDVVFDDVPADEYVLSLMPGGWKHDVALSSSGATPDFLHLPRPDSINLTIRYPADWSYGRPVAVMHKPVDHGIYTNKGVDIHPDGVSVVTVADRLELLLYFKDVDVPLPANATVSEDRTTASGELESFGILSLSLRDGSRVVCMRASWWDRVRFSNDAGDVAILLTKRTPTGQGDYVAGARYLLSQAGPLKVMLPPLPGYPPQTAGQVQLVPMKVANVDLAITGSACSR